MNYSVVLTGVRNFFFDAAPRSGERKECANTTLSKACDMKIARQPSNVPKAKSVQTQLQNFRAEAVRSQAASKESRAGQSSTRIPSGTRSR